jgi:hypothetical protein
VIDEDFAKIQQKAQLEVEISSGAFVGDRVALPKVGSAPSEVLCPIILK